MVGNKDFARQGERLMAMGQMAASLAHELRNPLGSMALYCTLLHRDLDDRPSSQELLEKIRQGIGLLDGIIRNCLQFSRDIRLQCEKIEDAESYFREIVDSVAPQSSCVEIQIADGVELYLDRYAGVQIFGNLIRNALDAVEGVALPEVVCHVMMDEAQSVIEVRDNGAGISSELLPQIFEPFVSSKAKGTGLGLPVVHTLVTAHGGDISVKSSPGKGTVVDVRLPGPTVYFATPRLI